MLIPYVLAALSLFLSLGFHWKSKGHFWRATCLSTLISVVICLILFWGFSGSGYVFPGTQLDQDAFAKLLPLLAGASAFFSLLVSMLVGYLVNLCSPDR